MLIHGAEVLLTSQFGKASRAMDTGIRIRDGRIAEIGALTPMPGEQVLDARGCVIYPAWVNTHHHLFQSLLKGDPLGINATLTPWLAAVPYRYRAAFDAERFRLAVRIGLVELALSGCGTVADHNYLYWPDMPFDGSDIVFDEASKLGLRMVLCRGGQTRSRQLETDLPKVLQPETLDAYLDDLSRLQRRYHDPSPLAMRRVVAAPTTPLFSMHPHELRETAAHARSLGLRLHSHLSETVIYQQTAMTEHGRGPIDFAASVDWLGPDVWFAHLVKLDAEEIALLGQTGTGIAHCPQSNGRLGSGIAPIRALEDAGTPISIAVDGAASNEAADMLNEVHVAWLMARARGGHAARPEYAGGTGERGAADATVEDVVRWGTAGGARVLGLEGVGTMAPGMAADIAVYALDQPRHFGLHDPAIGPVASGGASLRALLVSGRMVVRDGAIPGLDLGELGARARDAVRALQGLASV
ncbi:isoxanthopterin deaminase [mine drainage metagenome]|uniref:Isoxanthopterin deaminase n=1 Tax=mine drainage metagenome TaxID=410659 RepID=A0A1J5RI49_9ZZZZ